MLVWEVPEEDPLEPCVFVLEFVDFFWKLDALLVLPCPDFNLWTSRLRLSISLMAELRSAVSSDASLLKTLASSWSAFFVRVGVTGMTMLSSAGLV